ncbi:Arm DNA-binding domain-containing protein [Paraburkholderia fungorum]|uniref:Arm DNA-binding domain-containing protein n=1 Tax=Paraburkholderia fungorum TaxID=134537 RepID=UPI00217EF173
MRRRVELALAFRAAKACARSYLLTNGNGLALRVRPSDTRTWVLHYRQPSTGQENLLSLGLYPDITPVDTQVGHYRAQSRTRRHRSGINLTQYE